MPGAASMPAMRVAVVHEWLTTFAGSERVLAEILACFPQADLFAVADFLPDGDRHLLGGRRARTSFIQRLPFARRALRAWLPLMPQAVAGLDLSGYDLVISNHHAVAKGVLTGPDQVHVCYCHSPMRYAWDLQHQYLERVPALARPFVAWQLQRLRPWDVASAAGVDAFVANSAYIARRVRRCWRREAVVVHPPVDIDQFTPGGQRQDHYIAASRFVPYKRMDLIVAAFTAMPTRRLVVIGDGPELARCRRLAGPNVTLLGHRPRGELIDLLRSARAFVFAAEEDFGIVPVEAQACGTPVIAFGRGGATESVVDGVTGLFFPEQTVASLCAAVERFEAGNLAADPAVTAAACRTNAERFAPERFRQGFRQVVAETMARASTIDRTP